MSKSLRLKKHKRMATGLFVLMVIIYSATTWYLHYEYQQWLEYVKAFAEAAMVGALADWFAVTALFHHPLGLPIPHTNLIEKSKKNIGDNLGNFIINNFLTPQNIRPYILKFRISSYLAEWLSSEKKIALLLDEFNRIVKDILRKADDEMIISFITDRGTTLLKNIKLQELTANALQYFVEKNDHEQLITILAGKIKNYVSTNKSVVQERVKKESYFFIPKFIDSKLAGKITNGLARYFEEIEYNKTHPLRAEIRNQLMQFIETLRSSPEWAEKTEEIKKEFLEGQNLNQYANDIWQSLKRTLIQELDNSDSTMMRYFSRSINEFAVTLKEDVLMQEKIDRWLRHTAYRYILRNREKVGILISSTIGNWEGRELSSKLELEVGKDLQFIRINGTLVGGLVGLLIYTITHLLSK